MPPPSERFVPAVKWTFILLSIAIIIFQVVTIVLYLVYRNNPTYKTIATNAYEGSFCSLLFGSISRKRKANIWCYVAIQVLTSLAFLIYGVILLVRLTRGPTRTPTVVVDKRHDARRRSTGEGFFPPDPLLL